MVPKKSKLRGRRAAQKAKSPSPRKQDSKKKNVVSKKRSTAPVARKAAKGSKVVIAKKPKRSRQQGKAPPPRNRVRAETGSTVGGSAVPVDWDSSWSRLSKGVSNKEFEDMCLDLMLEEYGDEVIPGPRRSGRDRGFDGIFDGVLAGHRGRWKIACAVRQDVRQLEKKIDEERGRRPKRTFDSLLILTPLDMDAPTAKRLGQRAGKGIKRGAVWARGRLDRLVRKHPWIGSEYFNRDLLPGFVPLQTAQIAEIADQPDVALVGRERDLQAVASFLTGTKSVLLIVAPGGAGKSRFLRALAGLSKGSNPRRSPWARRPDVGTIEDGLKSGLPIGHPLLIALDDAGRVPGEARKLALASKVPSSPSSPDVKIVLAARDVDREALETLLTSLGDVAYTTHELSPLASEAAVKVALLEFPGLHADDARRLARHFGSNLFLLRAAARFVKGGQSPASIVDEPTLRGLVAAAFVREAEQHLAIGAPQAQARQILLEAALDVPLTLKSCSTELMTLREAGLFRAVGTTLRFRADVEGDLLLGHLLEQPWARALLGQRLSSDPNAWLVRVRNLAAAGTGHPAQVVRQICQSWISQADEVDRWARKAILEMLPHCARSAPDLVVELCLKYATTLGSHRMDDFGAAVIALARTGHAVDALRLLRQLAEAGVPDGMYSNYKVAGAAAEIASPAYLRPEQATAIVAELAAWGQGPTSPKAAEILQSALNKLLAPTVNWDTNEGATTSFHERALAATPIVKAVRGGALLVVEAMLVHPEGALRQVAAAILMEHTRANGGGMVPAAPGMKDLQAAEFQTLVPLIERRIAEETEVSVLAVIEEALVFRWATERAMADEAGRILAAARWPSLLAAFRLTTKPWEYYFSVLEAMREAPTEGRWSWWIEQRHSRDLSGLPMDEVDRVIDALRAEYPGAPGLAHVAQALERATQPEILFDRWCKRDLELFQRTLERTAEELGAVARQKLSRALRRARFSAPSFDLVAEMRALLDAGQPLPILQEVYSDFPALDDTTGQALSDLLTSSDDVDLRQFGLRILQYRREIPRPQAFQTLKVALRDGLWVKSWESVWSILHEAEAEARKDTELVAVLEERICEALDSEDAYPLGNSEWYIERILEIVVDKDVDRRQTLVARLVRTRNLWREPAIKLAAPLLKKVDSFAAFLRGLGRLVEGGEVHLERCKLFLARVVSEAGMPPGAMAMTKQLLEDTSVGNQQIGVAALCEMRETSLAAEACAFLADLAVESGSLATEADRVLHRFTMPRDGYSGAIGQPAPKLVQIQSTLKEATKKTTRPAARKRVNAMWQEVADSIQADLDRDAEVLEPR